MFINNLTKLYESAFKQELNKASLEWFKKKFPNVTLDKNTKELKKEHIDRLSKEDKTELLSERNKVIQEQKKLAIKELNEGFQKPSRTFKGYYNITKQAVDYYNKTLKEDEEKLDMPKISFTSSDEMKKRKALQIKASKLCADYIANMNEEISNKSGQELINGNNGKSFDRAIMNMCHYIDEQGNDTYEKNIALLSNPKADVNEKRELLDKIIKSNIDFTKALRQPMSDEEFLNKYGDKESLARIQSIAEVQDSNYQKITEAFGVKPSKEVEKEWRNTSKEMVGASSAFNRVGVIANPLYPEIKNVDDVHKMSDILSADGDYQRVYELANNKFGLKEPFGTDISSLDELNNFREKGKASNNKFLAFNNYVKSTIMNTKEGLYSITSSIRIPNSLSDKFGVDKENIKYTDIDGKELSLRQAYDKMYDGKTCKIYDKTNNKFLGPVEGGTFDKVWGGIEAKAPENLKVDSKTPEDLSKNIKDLNKEVNAATHWYMRSSKEFTKMRKAMEALGKPGVFDDKEKAKEKMQEVVDYANDYIKLKEKDGTIISDNTKKRLAIAHKIAGCFEKTLSESNLEKDLNKDSNQKSETKENTREQISVEEAHENFKQGVSKEDIEPSREQVVENTREL